MLGQNILKCTTILWKKELVKKINLVHVNIENWVVDFFHKGFKSRQVVEVQNMFDVLNMNLGLSKEIWKLKFNLDVIT
jgi:hypothetical protein